MNTHKTPSSQRLLALALALALPALGAASAAAQECMLDSDCASGDRCELSASTGACMVDEQGNVSCVEDEAVIGFCYTPPTPCMSDAECGPFSECQFASFGSTAPAIAVDCADETDCAPVEMELPPPMEPTEGFCGPRVISCDADADCPSSFHCEVSTYEVGCARPAIAMDCPENEPCPEPTDVIDDCGDTEPVTEGYCLPNELDCDSDAACPADWRCVQLEEYSCAGGGSTSSGVAVGAPEPAPVDPAEAPADVIAPEGGAEAGSGSVPNMMPIEEPDCVVTSRSLCVPEGWEGGVSFGAASSSSSTSAPGRAEITTAADPSAPDGAAVNPSSNSVESGGCDVAGGRGAAHLLLIAFALIGLRLLSRRARAEG